MTKSEDEILKKDFGIRLNNGRLLDKNYFPGFVRKAVSFTIADGIVEYDTEFINIVKPAGIRGSFNLISTRLNRSGLTDEEYVALYSGFEVSNHHVFHPLPWFGFDGFSPEDFSSLKVHDSIIYDDSVKNELDSSYIYKSETDGLYFIDYSYHFFKDASWKYWHPIMTNDAYAKYADETKKDIESLFGKGCVVGFAYPHGKTNDIIKKYFKDSGYLYARGAYGRADNTAFSMPSDRFDWSNNAIHSNLNEVMADFDALADDGNLKFFSLGVHASDFLGKWHILQEFADKYGNRQNEFYYASVREIFEYEDAIEALEIKDDELVNNSDVDLFVTLDGKRTVISAKSEYVF